MAVARDYPTGERIPGTVYQVVRRIGGGGMGTVYDVEDTTIGKRYVLKALHPQLGAREDLARRMQNEARTLARLNHPNIVEVITAGVTSDDLRLPYYVMERLGGQSLRLVLEKKGQLELPHAYHIAIDLLDALDHAHDKGVIHRDVKPDNIFLHRTSAGVTVTKLLDFGIVSLLDSGPGETAGRFLGTLRYAAPEQLRGESPSAQMDIYCAALVLYEMLAGRGPFDDQGDSQQIASAHLHQTAPPVSRFVPVPPELDGLLGAALAKVPDARPRDAFSFASSLRNLKRAFTAESALDSTENRATAPVVGAPASAVPLVQVRRPAPLGGYVVSPVPSPSGPPSRESLPRTTMRGMAPPTLGPALAVDSLATTVNHAHPIDREAPTHSLAEAVSPVVPSSTENMASALAAGVTVRAHPLPLPEGDPAAFRWPSDRPVVLSEEPQAHTVSASFPVGGSRAVWALALSAAVGLAAVGGLLLRGRHSAGERAPSALPHPGPPARDLPAAPPTVVPQSAPTIAPPAFDDPVVFAASSSATSDSSPAPTAKSATHKVRPAPSSKPSASFERPGPGF